MLILAWALSLSSTQVNPEYIKAAATHIIVRNNLGLAVSRKSDSRPI